MDWDIGPDTDEASMKSVQIGYTRNPDVLLGPLSANQISPNGCRGDVDSQSAKYAPIAFGRNCVCDPKCFEKKANYKSSLVHAELLFDDATAASMNAMPSTPS